MPSAVAVSASHAHDTLVAAAGDRHHASGADEPSAVPIPPHPLSVKPLGNRYLSDGPDARAGIGTWAVLPDEVLTAVLDHLGSPELLRLGSTCKFLYAFCHSDEPWKALFLR